MSNTKLARDTGELCALRYVGASGSVESGWWQWIAPDRILMAVRLGSRPTVSAEVEVCTNRSRPEQMRGRWVVVRKDEHTFLLTAARMPRDMQEVARGEKFHEDLPVGSILLCDAPPLVAASLASL